MARELLEVQGHLPVGRVRPQRDDAYDRIDEGERPRSSWDGAALVSAGPPRSERVLIDNSGGQTAQAGPRGRRGNPIETIRTPRNA
jgi:hypothetical protein